MFSKSVFLMILCQITKEQQHQLFLVEIASILYFKKPCVVKTVKSPKDCNAVRNAFGSIFTVWNLQKSQNLVYEPTLRFFEYPTPRNNKVPAGQKSPAAPFECIKTLVIANFQKIQSEGRRFCF